MDLSHSKLNKHMIIKFETFVQLNYQYLKTKWQFRKEVSVEEFFI